MSFSVSPSAAAPDAAVLLIGNELLSGRTQDTNVRYIAERLVEKGIRLMEARIIPDVPATIVAAVNHLRSRYTYVFTTGGIGPTHDDITADCIAEAFGVELPIHPEARAILTSYYHERGIELNADRLRMARIPVGASLIDNPVSAAPGFRMDNVFVFAGVPRIMQAMLNGVLPQLNSGAVVHSVSVRCNLGEGEVASALRQLQVRYPEADIGSYPGKMDGVSTLTLVARSTCAEELTLIRQALCDLIERLGGTPEAADS